MDTRLPVEARLGIIPDLLAWFMRCAGGTGQTIEPQHDSMIDSCMPWKWRDFVSSIRSTAYRTPYAPIGDYMERWWYMPELFGERARVHRTMRSDRDRDLHDHPWHFVSIILDGGYSEEIELASGPCPLRETHRYRAGDVLFRHAEHRHRLELEEGSECLSLVFTSQNLRDWGFWTTGGFVPWREYHQLEPA